MRASRTIAAALAVIFVVGILSVTAYAAPGTQDKPKEAKPQAKPSSMPKEIAALIQEVWPPAKAGRTSRSAFSNSSSSPPRVRIFSPSSTSRPATETWGMPRPRPAPARW